MYGNDGMMPSNRTSIPPPSPSPVAGHQSLANNPYGQQFAPPGGRAQASPAPILPQQSYATRASHTPIPPSPAFNAAPAHNSGYGNGYAPSSHHTSTFAQQGSSHGNYDQGYVRTVPQSSNRSFANNIASANAYNPPKQVETYTLPDAANASLPQEFKEDFMTDANGRILFFTAPPVQRQRVTLQGGITGHSLKYLAKKAEDAEKLEAARKKRDLEAEEEKAGKRQKREEMVAKAHRTEQQLAQQALKDFTDRMNAGTKQLYKNWYGEHAEEMQKLIEDKLAIDQANAREDMEHREKARKEEEAKKHVPIRGWNIYP